ncbi:MAG TPA: hypothetical protein VJH34_00885 [archaeon]|nr:hypothetical protein [archaeon]
MSEHDRIRTIQRLEHQNLERELVRVVYRDGVKQDSYFSQVYKGADGIYWLQLYTLLIDEGSKVEDETIDVPAHDVGYLFFPDSKPTRKFSMMPFQKPSG